MSGFKGKSELAKELGIHRNTLQKIIHNTPELISRLKTLGYNTSQRLYTPVQVDAISNYLYSGRIED